MSTGPRPARTPDPASHTPLTALTVTGLRGLDLDEVAEVVGLVQDFLRHASTDTVDELAGYAAARPADPSRWVGWVADLLGDHAITLRALHHATTTTTTPTPNGEPR